MNCFEGEPQLCTRLPLFERGHPEPAGANAFGQLSLREASGFAAFAYEGADRYGVYEVWHRRMLTLVNMHCVLMIINIRVVLPLVTIACLLSVCDHVSERVRTCPNVSECVRICPNTFMIVRMCPDRVDWRRRFHQDLQNQNQCLELRTTTKAA